MRGLDLKKPLTGVPAYLHDFFVSNGLDSFYKKVIKSYMPVLTDDATIVDLGCGGGRASCLMSELFPNVRILGVDPSHTMVAKALRHRGQHSNVHFIEASAEKLPVPTDSIDALISFASIKHWPDQAAGLKEVLRILKPGGTACIVEADQECSLEDAVRFVEYWKHVPQKMAVFVARQFMEKIADKGVSQKYISDLMNAAGFTQVMTTHVDGLPALVSKGLKPLVH